jgi:hypothetical protein
MQATNRLASSRTSPKHNAAPAEEKKSAFFPGALFRSAAEFCKIGAGTFHVAVRMGGSAMELSIGQGRPLAGVNDEQSWPLDLRMAMFLLESEGPPVQHGADRAGERFICRIRARVMRATDTGIEHVEIFLRDVNETHVGFVSAKALEVGADYELDLQPADGEAQSSAVCAVVRSRCFMGGWHEGALQIHKRQPMTSAAPILRIAV